MSFKTGDRVRVIKEVHNGHDIGTELSVVSFDGTFVYIDTASSYNGHVTGYFPGELELIEQESEPKSEDGGVKHDGDKPDFTFISYELLEEVAKVRAFGAKKYSRGNWKKGFKVTRSCAAALRHIFSFLKGETYDPESGYLHLAHAVCALEHAIFDMKNHPHNDDRA